MILARSPGAMSVTRALHSEQRIASADMLPIGMEMGTQSDGEPRPGGCRLGPAISSPETHILPGRF